jgi:hypothetical protein
VEYLEKVCDANLHKLSAVNKLIRKFADEWDLDKSWTYYHRYGKGPKTKLVFSKTQDPNIEDVYATHYINKKRITEINLEKHQKKSAKTTVDPNKQETNLLPDENKIATTN